MAEHLHTHANLLHRRDEQARRQTDDQQQDMEARKKEDERQNKEDGLLEIAVVALQAIESRIRENVETYQTATILALEENREALEEVRQQQQQMLDQAHVMEDGRRVFKSVDGERVFDEFGAQVSREDLDPDLIPDSNQSWEVFRDIDAQTEELKLERQDLLDFQQKLDEAEGKLGSGKLTNIP